MAYKKWVISGVDKSAAANLAEQTGADPFVTLIALSRGFTTPEELELFLSDEPMLSSPYDIPNMAAAAEYINNAINNGKKIAVVGDYDCDGITSTALIYSYLLSRGVNAVYYIPNRFSDGYGMSTDCVDALKAQEVDLIITVDNGISAVEEIDYAKKLGIETVVTDHHLPPEVLPNAIALVNPHLSGSNCEFKDVSGVMVAFKLVCALSGQEPEELLNQYSDLLAIGLVADVMPLLDENRVAVREGIKAINTTKKMGILALLNSAGIGKGSLTAGKISFGLSPRINAAGRMGSAEPALKLLLSNNFNEANTLAEFIEAQNKLRQTTEQEIFEQAIKIIEQNGYNFNRVIVVCGKGWHHGVLGIVAAKITEKYGKPSILLSSEENGFASGSGRSIEGFSLYNALKESEHLLYKFGGHNLAAGLTLEETKVEDLRISINNYAKSRPLVFPVLKLDCKLNPAAISLDIVEALKDLEPFGTANPTPVFAIYNLEVLRVSSIGGGKHTKLLLGREKVSLNALAFGVPEGAFPFNVGDIIDIAVTLDINEYLGKQSVSVIIKGFRKSGINQDKFFNDIAEYNNFKLGEPTSAAKPTREEIGTVYRFIKDNVTEETVRQRFIDTLGFFKTAVAIDVLKELDLIKTQKAGSVCYLKLNQGKRANLADSKILNS
ncbi:MAG: single-stranded-DNA-specific exonuclease RecJ [Clostridia bacterium]|nr:single-stranded-DNA-specific exonuclease RecJ [Clostridia bacterium]